VLAELLLIQGEVKQKTNRRIYARINEHKKHKN
jgi:hypothetical protein